MQERARNKKKTFMFDYDKNKVIKAIKFGHILGVVVLAYATEDRF